VRLAFSGNLLRFTGFLREIELGASSLGDAIEQACGMFPGLRPVLLNAGGGLRTIHQLYRNGAAWEDFELSSSVGSDDEVRVITILAGG
jgi:hypothetical protein